MSETTMTPARAIRVFFEADGGRKMTLSEIKQLSTAERINLGRLCAEALGVKLEVPSGD
jgi:hypothetical protein